MRKIFLMRGAPGSGKDTLIDQWGVRANTIGYDIARDLFGTTIHTFDGKTNSLTSRNQRLVAEMVKDAAEARMHNGETLFVSNTNTSARDLKEWVKIAERHAYKVYAVNVQGALSDADLLTRNANRPERDRVVESVILDMANRYRTHKPTVQDVTYIIPSQVPDLLTTETYDASEFDEVVVVGDIQGCGEALNRLFDAIGSLDEKNRLWVFVGDLFDRGRTPVIVHDHLSRPRRNIILVEGNHERSVRETMLGVRNYRASVQTVEDVVPHRGEKSLLNLINRGRPFFPFTFAGKTRWVTHAGIDPAVMDGLIDGNTYQVGRVANRDFMIGTGTRGDGYRNIGTYNDFSERLDALTTASPLVDVQYFGHRNDAYGTDPLDYTSIRPLETEVEQGEVLTAVVISKDGTERTVQVAGEGERTRH